MKLTKYQLIKINVESSGQTVKFSADTDKLYAKVQGLFISLPKDESHFGSTIELRIADQEIFPDGYETKMLTCNQSTSPNERFFLFDKDENVDAGGSYVDGRYTDGGFSTGITFPYTAVLYLKLKNH
ncbi:MAG: hypothetical protein V2A54_13270 [Bacteroidota bacterium]